MVNTFRPIKEVADATLQAWDASRYTGNKPHRFTFVASSGVTIKVTWREVRAELRTRKLALA